MKLIKNMFFAIERDPIGERMWYEFLYGFPNFMRVSLGFFRDRLLDRIFIFGKLFILRRAYYENEEAKKQGY